jgi:hypothetical protein
MRTGQRHRRSERRQLGGIKAPRRLISFVTLSVVANFAASVVAASKLTVDSPFQVTNRRLQATPPTFLNLTVDELHCSAGWMVICNAFSSSLNTGTVLRHISLAQLRRRKGSAPSSSCAKALMDSGVPVLLRYFKAVPAFSTVTPNALFAPEKVTYYRQQVVPRVYGFAVVFVAATALLVIFIIWYRALPDLRCICSPSQRLLRCAHPPTCRACPPALHSVARVVGHHDALEGPASGACCAAAAGLAAAAAA